MRKLFISVFIFCLCLIDLRGDNHGGRSVESGLRLLVAPEKVTATNNATIDLDFVRCRVLSYGSAAGATNVLNIAAPGVQNYNAICILENDSDSTNFIKLISGPTLNLDGQTVIINKGLGILLIADTNKWHAVINF